MTTSAPYRLPANPTKGYANPVTVEHDIQKGLM